jgi:hypothetical protein
MIRKEPRGFGLLCSVILLPVGLFRGGLGWVGLCTKVKYTQT